jgi:hypothetical protein
MCARQGMTDGYVIVDLPDVISLSAFSIRYDSIYRQQGCTTSWKLEGSKDNKTWATLSQSESNMNVVSTTVPISNARYKHFKISADKTSHYPAVGQATRKRHGQWDHYYVCLHISRILK